MGDEKPVGRVGGRTRFVSRFQKRLRAQRNFGFATKSVPSWKGGYRGGQFTPRGTTYVFVNVVVAPRYVARLRLGSGGLKYVVGDWRLEMEIGDLTGSGKI